MIRSLSSVALAALIFFALPLAAQQDTTAAGDRARHDAGMGTAADTAGRATTAVPGAESMGADSAQLGRQGEGVARPAGVTGQRTEDARAATTRTPSDQPGAEMPTTASSLPALLLVGVTSALLGLFLRGFTKGRG
jgi:hypothetical protein